MSIVNIENKESLHIKEREAMALMEHFVQAYTSAYSVNLMDRSFEILHMAHEFREVFTMNGGMEDMARFVETHVHPDDREMMRQMTNPDYVRERLRDESRLSFSVREEYNGIERYMHVVIMRTYDADHCAIGFMDVTAEKQQQQKVNLALKEAYEAAQLASNAKTTFLANMSHDIRTPMNAIIGMTAIAGAHIDEPDRIRDCLKKINSSGRHLLGLINQVLDMSKIESGKVDLTEEEFNISDLMDEVISMNHAAGKAKGHELKIAVSKMTHENVIGDRTRLEQVFNNLLSNAIKYTPDGGKIEISISEKETNKSTIGWYEVIVADNGIGMTEEFRKTIFEPFARADDVRAASNQGTGLGMPIARNIVRMMNGDIKVESEINKGSKFTVSFSLKLSEAKEADYESFVDLPVLVVDDDEAVCEYTCEMLNDLSMKSEYTTTGEEAVIKCVKRHEKQDDYFAVIMDWKMPGMDGIETTRQIRQRVGSDIPIIVLTSYDWSDIEDEAREAGVNAFINKPLFKSKVIELFSDLGVVKKDEARREISDVNNHDFTGKRILLAEDNELNREIALEILGMTGLEIDTAEDGSICVDVFTSKEQGYYDLILMDIQMPVMTGYDATRAIRASEHPDALTIPIIAMTANAFSTDVRAAFDAGMNGHISKPIDLSVVMKTLSEYL